MEPSHEDSDRRRRTQALVPAVERGDGRSLDRTPEPRRSGGVTGRQAVERGGGVRGGTSEERSEALAATASAAVHDVSPTADGHTAYAGAIGAALVEATDEMRGGAIARRGGLRQFLPDVIAPVLVTPLVTARPRTNPER